MKERPILFSAPMVQAILEGRKTQTRRSVKSFRHFVPGLDAEFDCIKDLDGLPSRLDIAPDNWEICPCGQSGDRLWVRENGWERPERTPRMMRDGADTWERYYYDADGDPTGTFFESLKRWGFKRRPSIHMPRWASRITLEVTRVRVERLQDISEEDATAEGCFALGDCECTARRQYGLLWDKINGAGAWDKKPWVWVVGFKRAEP